MGTILLVWDERNNDRNWSLIRANIRGEVGGIARSDGMKVFARYCRLKE